MRADYDPDLGRFCVMDPLGFSLLLSHALTSAANAALEYEGTNINASVWCLSHAHLSAAKTFPPSMPVSLSFKGIIITLR